MNDVLLVQMPYGALERPSLALSILKASVVQAGMDCGLHYATFPFAEEIGTMPYADMVWVRSEMIGEWTFAGAAFPDLQPDHDEYLRRVLATYSPHDEEEGERITRLLWRIREKAEAFIDKTARHIAARKPGIVACSSTFNQHTAVLAVTRRLKEIDPSITTILGGGNCEGDMGLTTLRQFPWIDFVVSGEADDLFAPLCRRILDRGIEMPIEDLPFGVFGAPHRHRPDLFPDPRRVPRAIVANLDATAVPDFDDYFAALRGYAGRRFVTPGLVIETSRGCWWGMVSHCTFCGLNGGSMDYRAKSPARALHEFRHLSHTYGVPRALVVDNILSRQYFHSVLPELASDEQRLTLFYEIKANVTFEQLRQLRDAGATWLQPGIESLHDAALALMKKGTYAWINLQLLKWARQLGLSIGWNILCGFPGEEDAWYGEMADLVPLLEHLEPCTELRPIRFDRFSPYHARPEEFGVRLQPAWPYGFIYGLPDDTLTRLVYGFEAEDRPPQYTNPLRILGNDRFPSLGGPGRDALQVRIRDWQQAFLSPLPPVLCMTVEEHRTEILDTRSIAPQPRVTLEGLAHRVYARCDAAATIATIADGLRDAGAARGGSNGGSHAASAPAPTHAEIAAVLDDLCTRKLMARLGTRYLALAIPGEVPTLPKNHRDGYPGGWVTRPPRARRHTPAVKAAPAGEAGPPVKAAPTVMATAATVATARPHAQTITLGDALTLDCGRTLAAPTIAYETYGTLSRARDNAILLCHPLTKNAHAGGTDGWWSRAIGPGRMFDTDRYFVICSAAIGGDGGSTGPRSIDPETAARYGSRFPVVTVADIVRAQTRLVERLGIARLSAVAGGCLGGQQALEWAIRAPERIERAIVIGTTAATSAHTIAIFDVMARLIRDDPAWRGGDYDDDQGPYRGLGQALAVAVPLWMTREAMEQRFGRRRTAAGEAYAYSFAPEFGVEAHLARIATGRERRLDPSALIYLMRAVQYFDLAHEFGSLAAAAARIEARVLLVSYQSDWRYPPAEVAKLDDAIRAAGGASEHVVLDSPLGHGAFLADVDACAAEVRGFLEDAQACRV